MSLVFFIIKSIKKSFSNYNFVNLISISSEISLTKKNTLSLKFEYIMETTTEEAMCLLDLPELALECILERLPPDGLRSMACVCSSLKDSCRSDRLWEKHLNQKWGKIIGPAAYKEWQLQRQIISSVKEISSFVERGCGDNRSTGFMDSLSRLWPFSFVLSNLNNPRKRKRPISLPVDSIMSWYLALETGKFLFPAQVYNRENGHAGFMLSCYDAELSYDSHTDTFQARYPPHGKRAAVIESGVTWDRVRAPPMDTSPLDLHISDCLNELRPGDHIEIQWKRNKEFPFGWWYGVIGHLELCDGNDNYCSCHVNGTLVLEFNHYTPGSQWRRATINRKNHREEGNEANGFYGGIRRIFRDDEISTWKRFWPTEVLE